MRFRLRLLVIVSAVVVVGIAAYSRSEEGQWFSFFEQKNYTVKSLLSAPRFDEPIVVSGTIEGLGEMDCPCFELSGGGQSLQVWYDLMLDGQNASQPKVDVSSLKNGFEVTLKGVLKKDQGTGNAPGLWLISIEQAASSLAPTAVEAQGTCRQQCVTMGFAEGACQTRSTTEPALIRVGDCPASEPMNCPAGDSECGCMCAPISDEPQLAAPPAAVFLLEQLRARSGIDFSRSQAIEMRYPPLQNDQTPVRWLVAAATTVSGDADLIDRIGTALTALGAQPEPLPEDDPATAGFSLWRKGQIICLAIRQELVGQKTGVELQCAVMPAEAS